MTKETSITHTDLKVGNFVFVDNKVTEVLSVDINGINVSSEADFDCGHRLDYEAYFKGMSIYSNSKEPMPIPLTEEWVSKFGLNDGFKSRQNEFGINVKEKEIWVGTNDGWNGDTRMCDVYYVHELQNIYSAFGELEIE